MHRPELTDQWLATRADEAAKHDAATSTSSSWPGGDRKWKLASAAAVSAAGLALLVNQVIGTIWHRQRPFATTRARTSGEAAPTTRRSRATTRAQRSLSP